MAYTNIVQKIRVFNYKRYRAGYYIIAIYIIILCMYSTVFRGQVYIPMHDCLDNNIAQYKMLHDTHSFFSQNAILPFLGGINRDYLPSELKVYSWAYIFLDPYVALVLYYILRVIISVVGSIFLGKRLLGSKFEKYENIILLCALLYSQLPVSPIWDIAFSIYPFLCATIHKTFKENWKKGYILTFFLPFFSELAHFGIFILGYILIFWVYCLIRRKKNSHCLLIIMATMALGYIVSEYRMFRLKLFSNEVSLRESSYVNTLLTEGLDALSNNFRTAFVDGQYHGATMHSYIVLPLCELVLAYVIIRAITRHKIEKFDVYVIACMSLITLNSMFYALSYNLGFANIVERFFPFLRGIGLERVIRLNTFIWYFLFAVIVIYMAMKNQRIISYILIVAVGYSIVNNPTIYDTLRVNIVSFKSRYIYHTTPAMSYDEVYSVKLFDKIKESIGYDGEWSIAFGIHPAILTYNGISTLDGYHSWYSQDYKEKFRQIIAPELEIDQHNREYFDNWGGRAYIFSNEATFEPVRTMNVSEAPMLIDPSAFERMGGKWVFSRIPITNSIELNMNLIGTYTEPSSLYEIYVYMSNGRTYE
ncbi:MAG: hypothetical protein HFH88_01010 [Lachnospiraceae bacterium]|nr:hypothetical protein [Lachnospiraceae bacterium]